MLTSKEKKQKHSIGVLKVLHVSLPLNSMLTLIGLVLVSNDNRHKVMWNLIMFYG